MGRKLIIPGGICPFGRRGNGPRNWTDFSHAHSVMYMLVSREGHLITLITVFETKPEQQRVLLDQLSCFAESVGKDEPACIGIVVRRSTDGTRVIPDAQWRSQENLACFARSVSRANASPAPASLVPVTNQH
jgi:hypothetical protein